MVVPRLKLKAARPDAIALALVAVVIAAFALRVYRLDWDGGRLLHPDELHVVDVAATRITFEWPPDLDNLFDPATSRLNPRSDDPSSGVPRQYAYGALPLLVTELVAAVMEEVTGDPWTSYFNHVHRVGRTLTATLDTGTVVLVFLLGRRLFDRRIGLLASAIYALAPMMIQLAHFFTTDSWLTFFVALTLVLTVSAAEDGRFSRFALAGGAFGLAMASKGSVIALAAVIAVAALFAGWRRRQFGETGTTVAACIASRLTFAAFGALACFALFEPYALARPSVYMDQLRVQSGIVRGTIDVAFTRQYVGTPPIVYQLEQLSRWGLGPVAGLLCLAGVVILLRRTFARATAAQLVLLAWLLIQGLVVVLPETKFLRYIAPLVPGLAIAGGLALDQIARGMTRRVGPRFSATVLAACLVGMTLWTAAFTSVYAAPHTRLEASRWIYDRVPPGSAIGVETWDDALPVPFGTGLTPWDFQYRLVAIDLYGDRPPETVAADIYSALVEVDYVVLASNRVERGVGQLPWRYPVQNRYYDLLRGGRLGFHLVADFHRSPGIGPVRIDDQSADESFINYDHPRVEVYEKASLVSRGDYDQLMAPAVGKPFRPTRSEGATLTLDEPVGDLPVVNDGRWSAGITDRSAVALVVWIALLIVLQVTGMPLARIALGSFADAGWSFARLIALLGSAYLVWLGASVKLVSFRGVWAAVAVAVVAGCWILLRRGIAAQRPSRRQWRAAWIGEGVFWIVFSYFLLLRWINPDSWHPFWGGEKPMEFAHINAILRSAHFPPYDPWFADGYINYYYYGLYLVAFCIKLTGIPAEIAFNLAQPTMLALLASAGYGVAATLGRGIARRRSTGIVPGVIGVVLLVGIGNLEAIRQVAGQFPDRLVPTFVGLTWQSSRVVDPPYTINEFPYFTGLYADLHAHVVALPMTVLAIALCLSLARDRRSLIIALSDGQLRQTARLALSVRLSLLSLTLGSLFPTNAWDVPVYAALAVVSIFMGTAGLRTIGARLIVTTTASLAVAIAAYLMFLSFHAHYVALFGSIEQTQSDSDLWQFADHLGGLLTLVAFGLMISLLGRRIHTGPFATMRIGPIAVILALLVAAAVSQGRTSTYVSGIRFAFVLAVALLFAAASLPGANRQEGQARLLSFVTAMALCGTLLAAVSDRLVLALMLAFAGAGCMLWLSGDGSHARFVGALVAAAALVAGGVEVVFLADDLVTSPWYRMNSVFKFYNQVWVLFGIAGAAFVGVTIARLDLTRLLAIPAEPRLGILSEPPAAEPETSPTNTTPQNSTDSRPDNHASLRNWAAMGVVASGLVILASLAYPLLATKPRLEERFAGHPAARTLNALDWMRYGTVPLTDGRVLGFADDLAAIDWLNDHVAGSPVIAEASVGPYRCNGSRVSINTGLPTIIGWERHERQQRYPDDLSQRVANVRELYASADPVVKLALIRQYDVRYVVVGQLERVYPEIAGNDCVPTNPAAGIAAFEAMLGGSLEVAFESGDTVIYRVLPPAA